MRVVCFDLDDTLYKEIDFLESAYKEIAEYAVGECGGYSANLNSHALKAYNRMIDAYHNGQNAFDELNKYLGINKPVSDYLYVYRNHKPRIVLSEEVERMFCSMVRFGLRIGLISDGRSVQQRNKIEALGLKRWIEEEDIIISEEFGSEKPAKENYAYFMKRYSHCQSFIYVGDNVKKDFIAPNRLGWETIGLMDDGRNIHKQTVSGLETELLPKKWMLKMSELQELLRAGSIN